MGDSISANSLFNSYIKTRKCSETEMVPSLVSEDHPLRLQWEGEKTLERDETVRRMKSLDRWKEDHKVTQPGARRKE